MLAADRGPAAAGRLNREAQGLEYTFKISLQICEGGLAFGGAGTFCPPNSLGARVPGWLFRARAGATNIAKLPDLLR